MENMKKGKEKNAAMKAGKRRTMAPPRINQMQLLLSRNDTSLSARPEEFQYIPTVPAQRQRKREAEKMKQEVKQEIMAGWEQYVFTTYQGVRGPTKQEIKAEIKTEDAPACKRIRVEPREMVPLTATKPSIRRVRLAVPAPTPRFKVEDVDLP